MYDANYWNNKWPKAPIVYSGRALRGKSQRIAVDVKNFITKNDELLKRTIERFNLRQNTANETAHKIQKFIVNHFTYKYDKEQNACPEFWQFPFESLQSKIGDCEDGAILIAGLMRHAGIPAYRVKVAAGEVQTSPTAPTGGHAYCIYLADKEADGKKQNWIILDWCFFEDSNLSINRKPLAKEGGYKNAYKDVWFTFNDEFSWNQNSLRINAERISNNRTKKLEESLDYKVIDADRTIDNIVKSL
jgi:hypothetical protein